MLDLFRHPEPWARARERVGVFKFVPPHVDPRMAPARNSYAALKEAGAFVLLRQWGIRIAVEEGAVKEWDCTGTKQAAPATIGHIANIAAAGAALQVVAMDEPLVSGQGACALSIDDIAARTAAYARAVRGSKEVQASGEPIAIGDIEPYPLPDAATLMTWVRSLIARGLKPAFLHLDINLHYVDVHPEIRLADDLRRLNAFFHETGIPLGIIIWSGYDPLNADRAYCDRSGRTGQGGNRHARSAGLPELGDAGADRLRTVGAGLPRATLLVRRPALLRREEHPAQPAGRRPCGIHADPSRPRGPGTVRRAITPVSASLFGGGSGSMPRIVS
jgi:hypothetical protein